MPALAFGLGWAAYTLTLWGYCLVRGYNVTLTQLVNPVHPVSWSTVAGSQVAQGQILPSKTGGADAAAPAQAD